VDIYYEHFVLRGIKRYGQWWVRRDWRYPASALRWRTTGGNVRVWKNRTIWRERVPCRFGSRAIESCKTCGEEFTETRWWVSLTITRTQVNMEITVDVYGDKLGGHFLQLNYFFIEMWISSNGLNALKQKRPHGLW